MSTHLLIRHIYPIFPFLVLSCTIIAILALAFAFVSAFVLALALSTFSPTLPTFPVLWPTIFLI